ncbi:MULTISPECIES: hypothetical protein [Mesorhizobium]|uniref:Uncharacterized protein n=1 Tax=Mesorhizobium shonense TaxID=1209948 RepID=A0ABV2I1Q1_9HYPH|nr:MULTISPECIES: hypothetical protein [unclassified Mesorhizobium]
MQLDFTRHVATGGDIAHSISQRDPSAVIDLDAGNGGVTPAIRFSYRRAPPGSIWNY